MLNRNNKANDTIVARKSSNMKKRVSTLLGLAIMILFAGCGSVTSTPESETQSNEDTVEIANPMTETTLEEINRFYPVELPVGAVDETCYLIENTEENPLVQVDFNYEDLSYTYRILGTGEDNDISGMYLEWNETFDTNVGYNSAVISLNEGKEGMIIWYDAAPGIKYTLIMETGATLELLEDMANLIYIPAQGDAP